MVVDCFNHSNKQCYYLWSCAIKSISEFTIKEVLADKTDLATLAVKYFCTRRLAQ